MARWRGTVGLYLKGTGACEGHWREQRIFVSANPLDGTKTEIKVSLGAEWMGVQLWVPLWANAVFARPERGHKLWGGQRFSSPEARPLPVPEGRGLERRGKEGWLWKLLLGAALKSLVVVTAASTHAKFKAGHLARVISLASRSPPVRGHRAQKMQHSRRMLTLTRSEGRSSEC